MAEPSRYHVSDKMAGVRSGVLVNKLSFKKQSELDNAETILLADAYDYFFKQLEEGQIEFGLSFLSAIHKYVFEPLYDWAGQVRRVNISKGQMLFAPVEFLDSVLEDFSRFLTTELSRLPKNKLETSRKLAAIHNEFNVIHPFREGNGRTIRLFLDLIAGSLGYNPIDWSKKPKSDYIAACIKGAKGEHELMA